ncbi:hypothetical protein TSOC_006371 [Tetrabaena socialis]|uniref:EF-hand domain-containing protein n=1 Tax=Tetrabaena socialis TaxID=47790 RepID=A0A2J8A3U3_9CHLO|nr:hypothetical protein TSOC_006371 [Tetrabaena socialis]|eukprot:PNH07200.1 hypothetical protein TSOC_006371 [Tetrabaena socialis]
MSMGMQMARGPALATRRCAVPQPGVSSIVGRPLRSALCRAGGPETPGPGPGGPADDKEMAEKKLKELLVTLQGQGLDTKKVHPAAVPACIARLRATSDLGKELTEEEVKEAIRILDTSKNGYVELDEFCAWWTKTKGQVTV